VALLHFLGHGSHVRDDWLRETFGGLRAGVDFTVIMDCCHSGTITRAIEPPDAPVKQRFLPSPWDLAAEESRRGLRRKVTSGLRSSSRFARKARRTPSSTAGATAR
jgi:hypothetical protein